MAFNKPEHTSSRIVEIRLPLLDRLETIHHATIVAVGRGRNKADGEI